MDIKRKLEVVEQAIKSITRHDDEDSIVLNAAMDRVIGIVEAERDALKHRQTERVKELGA